MRLDLHRLDPARLPTPLLTVADLGPACAELVRRFRRDPAGTLQTLRRRYVSTYTAARLRVAGGPDAGLGAALEPLVAWELSFTARRKLALHDLHKRACERGVRPLLIKGAATSLCFYAEESQRMSRDIDLVLPRSDIERFWPGTTMPPPGPHTAPDHVDGFTLYGVPVEIHFRSGEFPGWGEPADLRVAAKPCPGYPGFDVPSPTDACTIALLHIYRHMGEMPWDFIDLSRILESGRLDWLAVREVWEARGLTRYVIPGLVLMARLTGGVPPDLLAQLWGGLDPAARRTARLMGDVALSRRFHLWRETRLVCWLEGRPFLRSCLAQFAGSRAVTTRITGLAPSQPAFWWQHVAVLPLKRFRHLFG